VRERKMADNSYEVDDGYGGDEGSYEEGSVLPAGSIAAAAPASDLSSLVDKGHIKTDQIVGVQKRILVFEMNASPQEADKKAALCESKISDQNHQFLQDVRAIANRHDPKPEELSGDLDQIVITGWKPIGYISQPDHQVLVDFEKVQVPGTLTSNDRTALCLEHSPTWSPYAAHEMDIHSPISLMLKDMLQIWERCDDTVLAKEFNWFNDPSGKSICLLYHDGAGANLLRKSPEKYGGYKLGDKVLKGTNMVPIPEAVGRALYTEMKNTIEMIRKSFVSAKDIKATFRAPGGRWTDHSRYTGDVATIAQDKQIEYNARMNARRNRTAVHILVEYVPVPKQYTDVANK
jgi:hypothetical protein